jgi:hypothetical protein
MYQTPVTDICPMTNECVMAASVDNIAPGKRYDAGDDLTSPATGGGIPLGMGGGGIGSLLKMGRQLLPLLALGLMTASCGNEAEAPVPDEPTAGDTTPFTITAGIGEVSTRTDYTPNTGTGTDGTSTADMLNVVWGEDETLQALSFVREVVSSLTPTEFTGDNADKGEKSMNFTATGDIPENTTFSDWGTAHHYYYDYGKKGQVNPGPSYVPFSFDFRGQVYDVAAPLANLKNYDIMYTPQLTDGSSITLQHACAVIRFNLRLNSEGQAIKQITMSADADVLTSQLVLYYYPDGRVARVGSPHASGEVISLTIQNDDASNVDRTLEAYLMMPADDGGIDISGRLIKVSAIAADGTVYSRILNLTGATNEKLMAGACYTFFGDTSTPMAEDNYAGSNIYWDGSNFAFAEPNDMNKVKYQGLYFKWGSTVGIAPNSPVGTWTTYQHGVSGSVSETVWSNISYESATTLTTDICTTINSAYRMPTKDELSALKGSHTKIGSWSTITSTTTNASGTYAIPSGTLVENIFFPASGEMREALVTAGYSIYYWSNVASSQTLAYAMSGGNSGSIGNPYTGNKDIAFPIRCIKKLASEMR